MDESTVAERDLAAGFLFRENDGVVGQKVRRLNRPLSIAKLLLIDRALSKRSRRSTLRCRRSSRSTRSSR
jgi:hypothetical protein